MALCGWTKGRVLGRGSTATVSLASSARTGELFAVKSAALANSSSLQRERTILSSLNPSKHIVSFLGFDVSDGHYNIFLEYAPAGSLNHHIADRGGKLPEPTIRSLARDIVAGLAFLHSSEIVHCDVKSQNVLIGADGRAKVADLGCARLFGEGRPQVISGTPMFMAPEAARGEEQGPAADVWAAGCVVIEMATGRAPWPEAADAVAVLHRIAFSEDVPDAPEWLSDEGKDFLSRCLRRDPEERPTADELLAHPFLLNCADSDSDSAPNWTSPKSTLDQRIWESMEEEEEPAEQDTCVVDVEPQRAIAELVGSSGPNWTWDGEWLAIRTDGDSSREIQEADAITLDTDTDNLQSDPEDCPIVSSVGADYALSSTNLVSVIAYPDANCNCVNHSDEFSNNNEMLIMFSSCNWIFAFCLLLFVALSPVLLWLDQQQKYHPISEKAA